jgi:chitinase
MAVNSSDWYGRWFNHEPLLSLFDFLNVMTYDFHGPWGDHAGHNAPLRGPAADPDGATVNCEAAMRYWQERKGFPKDKLVLGLPCYGRSFLAAQWYTPVTGKSSREYITWHTTRDLIKAGWVRVWDAEAGVPYLRKDGETELISYEDEESALAKGAWAKAQGFRGIMFWEISQDTKDGSHIIVGAARKGFGL